MVEIIVAAVIFSAAAAGIFATIALTSRATPVSDDRLNAARCAKMCLDGLSKEVKASGSAALTEGEHPVPANDGCPAFTYTVEIQPNGESKVTVDIDY